MRRNFFTIALSLLLLLVTTLGLLLWVRTTRTEQNTVAVSQEFQALRQEFGQKKWQGYDISQAARILKTAENSYEIQNFAEASSSLSEASAAMDSSPLLYRDHAKSISRNPANKQFLFLPWTTYTPFDREVEWAAQRYDLFVLSSSRSAFVETIKTYNPDAEIYLYVDLPIKSEFDEGNGSLPALTDSFQIHPEWFLTTSSGRPVTTDETFTYYWPDPANSDFREQFIAETLSVLNKGQVNWDGIVLDNFRTLRDLSGDGVPDVASYPSDETFRDAQLAFLDALHQRLALESQRLVVELPPYATESDDWQSMLTRADGAIISGFGREEFNTENGHLPTEKFRQQLRIVDQSDRTQKRILLMTSVPFWSDKGISLYGYAGMLLGRAQENDLLYYYGLEDSPSIPAYWYREYELELGNARGDIVTADELLIRLFERGAVVLNPTSDDRSIQFDQPYQTVQGIEAVTFTLAAHQALILKKP